MSRSELASLRANLIMMNLGMDNLHNRYNNFQNHGAILQQEA